MVGLMYEFQCCCVYVGIGAVRRCPVCNIRNSSSKVFMFSTGEIRHQAGDPYPVREHEQVSAKTGRPKLSLLIGEYKVWELEERCFWASCGGSMKINSRGHAECSECGGMVYVSTNS